MLAIAALAVLAADYTAPASCPDEASFWGAVRARTTTGTPTPELALVITSSGGAQLQGSVAIGDGEPRTLYASSCVDLVEALALVTALLIDREPARAAPRAPVLPTPEPAARLEDTRLELSIGAGAAMSAGVVPELALAVPVFVELAWPSGLAGRVGLSYAGRSSGSDASFRAILGRVEGCARFELGAVLVAPCAGVDVGLLAAEPTRAGIVEGAASDRLHLAAGLAGHVRLPLRWGTFLEAGGRATAVITRHRYLFSPNLVVFSSEPVALELGLSAGVTIP